MASGGKRVGAGRPKGSPNKGTELGRKTIFQSTSVSGKPEEIAHLKALAEKHGKTVSRLVLDWALSQTL